MLGRPAEPAPVPDGQAGGGKGGAPVGDLPGRIGRVLTAWRRDGLGGLADRLRLRVAFRAPGPWRLRLQGGRFSFAHRGELYAYVETFVHHVYDRLPDFTPRAGWAVVDVGANVGCFSAYALYHMRSGVLCALEPNPDAYDRLQALATGWRPRRPGLRLSLRRAAAGRVPGRAAFVVPAGASVRGGLAGLGGESGGAPPPAPGGPPVRFDVDVLTLDDYLAGEGLAAVDLLKIDVEGAEVDVLAGAPRTLAHTGRVVLEWHGPQRLAAVRAALEAQGFRTVHVAADPQDAGVGIAYFRRGAAEVG